MRIDFEFAWRMSFGIMVQLLRQEIYKGSGGRGSWLLAKSLTALTIPAIIDGACFCCEGDEGDSLCSR